MTLDKIYLRKDKKFAKHMMSWAEKKSDEIVFIADKSINIDHIDALLIINENQQYSKEIFEIKLAFDNKQKSTLKLDINGTLMATVSNLGLWFERVQCKTLLILGSEDLVKNENLNRLLNSI
jgi:hypothetical protein